MWTCLVVACTLLIAASPRQTSPTVATPVAAKTKIRLVVSRFDGSSVPDGFGDIVADLLTQRIRHDDIELLERRQVKKVLDEQDFSNSDLSQPGAAVRFGRIQNADLVLVGTVYRVDGVYIVSAQLVDAVTAVIKETSRANVRFKTIDDMDASLLELARLMGLRQEAGAAIPIVVATPSPAQGTVQDLLERVGGEASVVQMKMIPQKRLLEVGDKLQVQVQSKRAGFLTLLVVDAQGSVALLIPNKNAPRIQMQPDIPITIPTDAGFNLRVKPPLGTTRLKAIITDQPLNPPPGVAPSDYLKVALGDILGNASADKNKSAQVTSWVSAEIEFLVIERGGVAPPQNIPAKNEIPIAPSAITQPANQPATPPDVKPIPLPQADSSTPDAQVKMALENIQKGRQDSAARSDEILHWPLRQYRNDMIDIAWQPQTAEESTPLIGVIDGDFDPDDPVLARAFRNLDAEQRDALRHEIRRNGDAPIRHGNQVASLIAGQAAWLPSALPGATLVPVRVTTAIEGPAYRVDKGDGQNLLLALRTAMNAGCRVINMSLSIGLDANALRAFADDPIWNELEKRAVVVVCAAGNNRENLDINPVYPACLDRPNILCVGALNSSGTLATWDNGSGSAYGLKSVDVLAPGMLLAVSNGGGSPTLAQGTSHACAFATAAAAHLLALEPNLTSAQVVQRLVADARALPEVSGFARGGLLQWPTLAGQPQLIK